MMWSTAYSIVMVKSVRQNTIDIYHDKIRGSTDLPTPKYINLSSCPHDMIPSVLARIPENCLTMERLDVLPQLMFSITNKTWIKKKRNTAVTAILDSDADKVNDLLIRMVKQYTGLIVTTKVIIHTTKSYVPDVARVGVERYMCNHHHTDAIIKTLGVTVNDTQNMDNVARVVIMKTIKCVIPGIAGLTYALYCKRVPYTAVATPVDLPLSLVKIDKDIFFKKYYISSAKKGIKTINSKRPWRLYYGYSQYITTEDGVRMIGNKSDDIEPDIEETTSVGATLETSFKTLIQVIKKIIGKVTNVLRLIWNKIRGRGAKVQVEVRRDHYKKPRQK